MTITDSNTIDIVSLDKENKQIVLIVTDHLEWDEKNQAEHFYLIQEKINSYISAIESKEIYKRFISAKSFQPVIKIIFKYELPKSSEGFLDTVAEKLSRVGITFCYEVLNN